MAETQPHQGRDTSRETVRQHRDRVGPSLEAPCRAVGGGTSRPLSRRPVVDDWFGTPDHDAYERLYQAAEEGSR